MWDVAAAGLSGALLVVAAMLIGTVVAVEAVVVVSILTLPAVGALRRWLPGRRAADRRAEALLRSVLTAEEFAALCVRGYLEVWSPSRPERAYRIPRTRGTVDVYERGHHHSTLCIAPVAALPDDDVVAAHKLMILGDEARYLATANRVAGARWENPAPLRPPDRAGGLPALLRLMVAASVAAFGAMALLSLARLSGAHDMVLALVFGWPVVIAAVSILAGLAVLLLGAAARPRRSQRQVQAGRRLA